LTVPKEQRGAPRVTKKHQARAQRERIMRNWTLAGALAVVALVVGLIAYGLAEQKIINPRRAVAVVNGEKITSAYVQARYVLARYNLQGQANQIQQIMSMFGGDATFTSSLESQLSQINSMLDDAPSLKRSVLDNLVEETLIRQEAQRRGIVVSEAEVDAAVQEAFGFYRNGTPTPVPVPTLSGTYTPSPTLTPTIGPSPTVTPTLAPSATPTSGPSPTPLPTATPYTMQAFEKDLAGYVESLTASGVSEADFRSQFQARLYRDRLEQALQAEVTHEQEQVHARHILVADEATANSVLEQLAAGKTWEELAASMSLDTSNKDQGGDLGWFGRGAMVQEFEDAAFAAAVGVTVGPVKTDFGWHLIQVLGHEMRPLDDAAYQSARENALSQWLADATTGEAVVIPDNWLDYMPQEQAGSTPSA
jgi:peptidyl-prolyl cis-trans isomerase D